MQNLEFRMLGPEDATLWNHVAPDVFDGPVNAEWWAEFLADPRHHLAIAIEDGWVVGMASGVHYVHPDKKPELWVNEVGVTPSHRGRGIGRRIMETLFSHARTLGCGVAWVLTEDTNLPARRLYAAVGGEETVPPPVLFTFALDDAYDSPPGP